MTLSNRSTPKVVAGPTVDSGVVSRVVEGDGGEAVVERWDGSSWSSVDAPPLKTVLRGLPVSAEGLKARGIPSD